MKNTFLGTLLLLGIGCFWACENTTGDDGFVWDFSEPKKFIYQLSQEKVRKSKRVQEAPFSVTEVFSAGQLHVAIQDTLADLMTINMVSKAVMIDENGSSSDTIRSEQAPTRASGMQADGSFGKTQTDFLFQLLMPLPKKDLQKGERDMQTLQIPLSSDGKPIYANGTNELLFEGYETINGMRCAVLKSYIDIKQEFSPRQTGMLAYFTGTGEGTYYFNQEGGYYVGGDLQITMETRMRKARDEKGMLPVEERDFAELTSTDQISYRLDRVVE